jgi:5-methylcytosine-specific restriction endonuclease McrA
MTAAGKVCCVPGCPTRIPSTKSRCKAHGGNKRTGKPRPTTSAWRKLRTQVLARASWRCERCGAPATEVHHRVPVARSGKEIVPLNELEALCGWCHRSEHTGEGSAPLARGRVRPGGVLAVRINPRIARRAA